MSLLSALASLSGAVEKTVSVTTDWLQEPLKGRQLERDIKRDRAKEQATAEAKISVTRAETDDFIRRETEVKRILNELEEVRKDNEFSRMQKASDAVMRYQLEISRVNLEAINAIGHMQLDLREKAQKLVLEKTHQYQRLQDEAYAQAESEITRLESDPNRSEAAKAMLLRHIDQRLSNIVDASSNFLRELSADIGVLNKSITLLTERSEDALKRHLEKLTISSTVPFGAPNACAPPVGQKSLPSS